jgi:hypothetical protein
MISTMPMFIELSLSNGGTLHLDAEGNDPARVLERWAKRNHPDNWVETLEGAWVNPDQVVSVAMVDLQAVPTSHQ